MIGDNIKKARKSAGISQEELAVKLNVVRQTVSKWENSLSVPDADVLLGIAEVLGAPVSELLGISSDPSVEALGEELARVNQLLAEKIRREEQIKRANEKRGQILLLSIAAMLIMSVVDNPIASVILSGAAMIGAAVILYRNLALLTSITTEDMKLRALRQSTVFSIAVVLICVVAVLILSEKLIVSENTEKWLAVGVISAVMIFCGYISPRLPFTRHTGLRLPWTVQDEETWMLAHRLLGYISLPLAVLYIACAFTVDWFEAVSTAVIALWIGIPSIASLIFFWKKTRIR